MNALAILMWTSSLATSASPHATWAGHHVHYGSRKIPFRGMVRTRTDTYVIARMRSAADGLEVVQKTCHVRFKPVGGVQVSMDARALPESTLYLDDDGAGGFVGRSVVEWSNEDVDGDGKVGATVHVRAPVCSGELYVANRSVTKATARLDHVRLEGGARVHVKQRILGAQGACLSVVAKGTDERQSGSFAFVPARADSTCSGLLTRPWPVNATKRSHR